MENRFVGYWEKSKGWINPICEMCRNVDSSIKQEVFRRKFSRRIDLEPQNDDPCIVTLCEECFIKSR